MSNIDQQLDSMDEWSIRAHNCFRQNDIRTLRELALKTDSELLKMKNFGRKTLKEVREILCEYGYGGVPQSNIQPSCLVRLIGGGPPMTVERVDGYGIECYWFDGAQIRSCLFSTGRGLVLISNKGE